MAAEQDRDQGVSRRHLLRGSVAAGAALSGAAFSVDALRNAPPAVAAAIDGLIVQMGDATVSALATTLDFATEDFVVTESPAGEANIKLAAGITRDAEFGMISVKSYGAKGDGVTNDQWSFGLATYFAGVLGRTLYIPAGTYLLTGVGVAVGSNTRIVGQRGAKLLLAPGSSVNTSLIRIVDGATDVSIEGLELHGNRTVQQLSAAQREILATSTETACILIGTATNVRIANCVVHDSVSHGISDLGSTNCEIVGNRVHSCDNGGIISRGDGTKGWRVHHNVVENLGNTPPVTWHGIDVKSVDAVVEHNVVHNVGHDAISGYWPTNLRVTIANNLCWNDDSWHPFDNGGGHGVHTGGSNVKVIGNVIYHWNGASIFVRNDPNTNPPPGAYVEIIGNTVHEVDGDQWGGAYSGQGIRVDNFIHGIIANNRVSHTDQEGILLQANYIAPGPAGSFTISGNELEDNGFHGISIVGATDVAITGNAILQAGGSPVRSVGHGIRLLSNATGVQRVTIVGNTVRLSTGDGINATDTGIGCQNVAVSGNVISSSTGWGIRTQGKSNRFCVTGNVLTGNTGGAISLIGTPNVNANNLT